MPQDKKKIDRLVFLVLVAGDRCSVGGAADILFEIKPEQGRRDLSLHLEANKLALANLPLDSSLCPTTVWLVEMLTKDVLTYTPNIQTLCASCRVVEKGERTVE